MPKLKGWATFTIWPDGSCFLSDSYETKREAERRFENADINGTIDLSLIPDEAFHPLLGKPNVSK